MHAVVNPVQVSGLSGSGTVTEMHVVSVHETKGKDYGHATVSYKLSGEGGVAVTGTIALENDDYMAGKAADGEVLKWLSAKLGLVVTSEVSDPAPERKVDEVQNPEQPEG